jgi:hypothetical protein
MGEIRFCMTGNADFNLICQKHFVFEIKKGTKEETGRQQLLCYDS